MPRGQTPFPSKFTVQLSKRDNDDIFMLSVRSGVTPGHWARAALKKAIIAEKEALAIQEG